MYLYYYIYILPSSLMELKGCLRGGFQTVSCQQWLLYVLLIHAQECVG